MIPASYYAPIFYNLMLFLVIIKCVSLISLSKRYDKIERMKVLILSTFLIIFLGNRPISGSYFGDTSTYASFYDFLSLYGYDSFDNQEWLWNTITLFCAKIGLTVHGWFLVIDFLYIGLIIWACKRCANFNIFLAILFCFSSFIFYSGAVNGLRIGVANSLLFVALTYISQKGKKNHIIAILLSFLAFGIHKSMILPILSMSLSLYFIKNTKFIIKIWVVCIFISLILGNQISAMFESLGLFSIDKRFEEYLNQHTELIDQFSKTGFRWDFLLYSSVPIFLGGYLVLKRKIMDKQFLILLHTYIITNAFWILVIHASFSNRFASLSWSLYPILLAYPLINFKIWNRQERKTALFLVGHMAFSYLMWLKS